MTPTLKQRAIVGRMAFAEVPFRKIASRLTDRSTGRPMSLAVFRRTFQVELDAALACRTALVVNELHRDAVDGDEIAAGVWLELFSKRARHTVKMNEPEELLPEIRKRQRAYRREFRHMNKIDVTGAYGMPPSQKLGRPEPGESREGR